jgi:hypothetical protein
MYHRARHVKAKPLRAPASKPAKSKAAAKTRPAVPSASKATAKPAVLAKRPGAAKPAPVKKATNGAAAKPPVVATKLVGKPVATAKPVAAKPVAAKPVAAKPVAAKPVAAKPVAVPAAVGRGTAKAAKVEAPASLPPPKKPARKSIKEAAGVSTDAVARRTGKSWDDWFEVLDSAGAQDLDQRGVIAILAQKHGIGPWWQQMIAVGYESLRAKSERPPAPDGFNINSSCTLDAPLPRVFRLWNDAGERARWLADDRFVVRGTTADKIIRARWGKGTSHVAVSFAEKSGRTEVSVAHQQIESQSAAEQMKAYWAKKLGLLDQALTARR